MNTVTCYCRKCEAKMGVFKNSWNGIGSTYFSPVHPPSKCVLGFVAVGEVHNAASSSKVKDSFLQDIVCRTCRTLVGLRCDRAPAGHMLKRNQLLLRLAAMSIISDMTGEQAMISLLNTFPLTAESVRKSSPRRASSVQILPPPRRQNGNAMSLPPLDESHHQRDLANCVAFVEDAIKSQKRDLDRCEGSINRIEKEMESFRGLLQEFGREIVLIRNHQGIETKQNHDLGMNGLGHQIKGNSQKARLSQGGVDLRISEFNVATENILQTDQKSTEIDELRTELQYLKARLRPLEETFLSQNGSGAPMNESATALLFSETEVQVRRASSLALSLPSRKWSYTGPPHQRSIKEAFIAFDIKSGNTRLAEAILKLENHVNESEQQNTIAARTYGTICHSGNGNSLGSQETQSYPLCKRKHEEVERRERDLVLTEQPQLTSGTKRGRLSEVSNHGLDSRAFDEDSSPSLIGTPQPHPTEILSSDRAGSPILGQYDEHGELNFESGHVDDVLPVAESKLRYSSLRRRKALSNQENEMPAQSDEIVEAETQGDGCRDLLASDKTQSLSKKSRKRKGSYGVVGPDCVRRRKDGARWGSWSKAGAKVQLQEDRQMAASKTLLHVASPSIEHGRGDGEEEQRRKLIEREKLVKETLERYG